MKTTKTKFGKIVVLGKRVLVEKEKVEAGGFNMSPIVENEGQKNKGSIIAIGDLPAKYKVAGVKVGRTILFKKFFIPNHVEGQPLMVFVELEDILAII